ncbi:MAG TPA: hypothetical protein VM223_12455 [Planctomycetota bacterium]|nr:hypothetical protein [Planctomycetota bacterium]HUW32415.1 hypothetical protein [Planctomycetota bacterium]
MIACAYCRRMPSTSIVPPPRSAVDEPSPDSVTSGYPTNTGRPIDHGRAIPGM